MNRHGKHLASSGLAASLRGRTRTCRRHFGRSRAFTLVELIVSIAVTALIVGLLVGVLNHVTDGWAKATGRMSTAATARVIFEQIAPDLESALFRDDGNTWMAIEVRRTARQVPLWVTTGAPARQKPDTLSDLLRPTERRIDRLTNRETTVELPIEYARYGTGGAWLRFFTVRRGTNADNATISAPVAIGYQLARRPLSANPQSTVIGYNLYRMEVRPSPTRSTSTGAATAQGVLSVGYNLSDSRYNRSSTGNTGNAGDPASLYTMTNASAILGSLLAENVVDFGVRFYERDDATQRMKLIFPANAAGQVVANRYTHEARSIPNTPVSYLNKFPEVIEVMVRILTEEGAAQLAKLEANPNQLGTRPQMYRTDAEWWWGIVEKNSHVYVRRIEIAAPPQQ